MFCICTCYLLLCALIPDSSSLCVVWRGYICKGSHCAVPVYSPMRVCLAALSYTRVLSYGRSRARALCMCALSRLCSHMVLSHACSPLRATWRRFTQVCKCAVRTLSSHVPQIISARGLAWLHSGALFFVQLTCSN